MSAPDAGINNDGGPCTDAGPPTVAVPCLPDGGPSIDPSGLTLVISETLGFQSTIQASCGTPPYTWTFSGALPQGVDLVPVGSSSSPTSVVISGQARSSAVCPYLVALEVKDALRRTATAVYSLQVNP